ncbi:nuclear pore complex protein nup85-like [Plakobranchus ocellatus]|uniref:Nuclear pore complex protein Nup85 n=1 Tax=Plakobranchus ocellatus TaxID=259542 RepID=A0AAV4A828_9GAST|nr:nuclear pore complex protein nup85-like [Plakobranchus ocellatus]
MASSIDKREISELNLPVPKLNNCGLNCEWGLGKQLHVFQTQNPPANVPDTGELGLNVENQYVFDVRWNAEMHDIARKLVNESHNIFVMLQGQVKSLTESALDAQLRKASKHYRGVLKASTMELIQMADTCEDEARKMKYETYIQEFEIVQLIWSLCQIIFIDAAPGKLYFFSFVSLLGLILTGLLLTKLYIHIKQ